MKLLSLLILVALANAASADPPGAATKHLTAYPADDAGCASAVKALRARYDVRDVTCQPSLYKTSYPAKLLLTFTLDGQVHTEYAPVHSVRTADTRKKPAPKADDAPK